MAVKLPIYMDNHATTPVDPRVVEAMLPYFTETYGNASSRNHAFGWAAESAVDNAREQLAALIGAKGKEVVFTSGATESNNLALKGAAKFYADRGKHIVTVLTEHKCVLDTSKRLEKDGYRVTYLTPGTDGLVSAEQLVAALEDDTVLVSIMLANNEIGVIQPIAELCKAVKDKNSKILFHTDAAQAVGKIPVDVNELGVDFLSASGHKMYGPKGVGLLWVRRRPRVRIEPIIDGGGHERGMRSGTLNVPAIVGFGKAAEIAQQEMELEAARTTRLRNKLLHGLEKDIPEIYINGSMEHRLPGNLNVSFAFVEGESLLMACRDVAVSSGSACTSASLEPSYVLKALGVGEELAHSSIRFGLGRFNTEEEVDYVRDLMVQAVSRLREMSPLWEMHQEGVDLASVQWTAH